MSFNYNNLDPYMAHGLENVIDAKLYFYFFSA